MSSQNQRSGRLEWLLQKSVHQYEKLLLHAEKLEGMVKEADYSNVAVYTVELDKLQATAGKNDAFLLDELENAPGDWEKHRLFSRRQELIDAILTINTRLMPALTGALAVAREEGRKMTRSRSALAGYTAHHTASQKISSSA